MDARTRNSRSWLAGAAAGRRHQAAAALAGLALAAVAAGCGTARAPAGGPPAASPVSACTAAAVRVTLDRHAAGVAAGTSYLALTFTNVSASACDLAGYPQVAPADGPAGRPVGANAATDSTVPARPFALGAGKSAHAWLLVTAAANLPAAQCHPVAAPGLRVTLPGQARASFIRFPVQTCARRVGAAQVVMVQPFRPGRARKGSAQ